MSESLVGRVICSSTKGFTVGCQRLQSELPVFGSFVKAYIREEMEVYGLIYNVAVDGDLLVRQLAVSPEAGEETLRDQRENRQVPIEVSVLVIGYKREGEIHRCLPPQPPLTLSDIYTCTSEEIKDFTASFDYFPIVLGEQPGVPSDELLAASLRLAADSRGNGEERHDFLVAAGRELAALLNNDQVRLTTILRRLSTHDRG